ncbi:MAG: SGNH/GDSL hydrolase family protein [Planctomycetes bacterium]|nr:SGNH/GDSL hydrolase family protein [Planctomycetota bacterium]
MRLTASWVLLATVAGLTGFVQADEPPAIALKSGDRIVFLGDSITQGGDSHDKGYVRIIRKALTEKHPDLKLEVIGAGISGNKVPDLQRRLERDVIARKPTLVVIYIGINDVWHGEKDPARGTMPDAFKEGLKDVVGKCQTAGAAVVLCTPTVIGEKTDGQNGLDEKLDAYSDITRGLAKELKLPLCDLRKAFVDYLAEHNKENHPKGILTGDRVHLNETGNKFVADQMLLVIDK